MDKIDKFTRTRWLLDDKFEILQNKKVLICGVGGVGGLCVDALVRSGVGEVYIIDKDVFDITNQNRQLYSSNVGAKKVDEFVKVHPNIKAICQKIDEEFINNFDFEKFDLIVDAIDDIDAKILLMKNFHHKLISSMGGAKRLDSSKIKIASIWKTSVDPFARKIRTKLRKINFKGNFDVVFSTEEPNCKKLGSFMGVTACFGLFLASLAVQKLIK